MSYRHQDSTLKDLQKKTDKDLRNLSAKGQYDLNVAWEDCRSRLRNEIISAHKAAGTWNRHGFNRVRSTLSLRVNSILQQFHAKTVPLVKHSVKAIYYASMLRHGWMLDQVMPDSKAVKIPRIQRLAEADIIDNPADFEALWSSWMDAYNSALIHNLGLNALNEGSLDDAVEEVDATRANTPSYKLIDALSRIFDWESASAISEGERLIAGLNEDALNEEVWRTRGDLRVCDDCDANEGMSVEDVGYPPMHPNCNCFTQMVPSSFAELLRSGDEADISLADQMERDGVVPNAMVIRDADGNISGKVIVDFHQWLKDQEIIISGT
jgi:hypothetical protein